MKSSPPARRSFFQILGAFLITASLAFAQDKNPLKDLNQPHKGHQPRDLLENGDFLSHNGFSTLVPKDSILHVPKHLKGRIQFERGSRLVIWPKFFRENRDWIKTMEVTREQAQGIEPFSEEVIANIQQKGVIVVATFKASPIAVLKKKEPED